MEGVPKHSEITDFKEDWLKIIVQMVDPSKNSLLVLPYLLKLLNQSFFNVS